jgi:hypothetical protein
VQALAASAQRPRAGRRDRADARTAREARAHRKAEPPIVEELQEEGEPVLEGLEKIVRPVVPFRVPQPRRVTQGLAPGLVALS